MRIDCWTFLGLLLAAGSAWAQPAVSFESASVVVDGASPGARVAVLTLERGLHGLIPYLTRADEVLVDDDGDGTVRLELDAELPPRTLAVAVDLTSGATAAAAADGDLVWRELGPGALGATRRHLQDDRSYLAVLVARPGSDGSGAWAGGFGDGSPSDDDGVRDHRLRASIARLVPVGESPPTPDRVALGDVIVVIDPETLELFTVRLSR